MSVRKFEITGAEGGAAFPVLINIGASANQITGKDQDIVHIDLATSEDTAEVNQTLITFLSEQLQLDAIQISVATGRTPDKRMVFVTDLTPLEIEDRLFGK